MSKLEKTLPPSVAASDGIGALLQAMGAQTDALEQLARTACRRLAATTADDAGLTLWERELALPHRPDLLPDARRALVLAALEQFDTCTPARLRSIVKTLTGGTAAVTEQPAQQTVGIALTLQDCLQPDIRSVQRALRQALPAHLALDFSAQADLRADTRPGRRGCCGIQLVIHTTKEESV